MRKSARYIAQELIDFSVADVYELWKDMGLVKKDGLGGWSLTALGFRVGGRVSRSNYNPVPTFESDKIIDMMIDFCKNKTKG